MTTPFQKDKQTLLEQKLNLSDHFYSLQGEGVYAGTPMYFIRFAGCSVGFKKFKPPGGIQTWGCETLRKTKFLCDTDFSLKERVPLHRLVALWKKHQVSHLCVTGGEPFDQPVENLNALESAFIHCTGEGMIHYETSGTVNEWKLFDFLKPPMNGLTVVSRWLTVSPKFKYHKTMVNFWPEHANEMKLLMGGDAEDVKFLNQVKKQLKACHNMGCVISLQPIKQKTPDAQTVLNRHVVKLALKHRLSLSLQTQNYLHIQ